MTFQHLFVVQFLISFSVIVFLDVFPLFVEQGAFLHSWHTRDISTRLENSFAGKIPFITRGKIVL